MGIRCHFHLAPGCVAGLGRDGRHTPAGKATWQSGKVLCYRGWPWKLWLRRHCTLPAKTQGSKCRSVREGRGKQLSCVVHTAVHPQAGQCTGEESLSWLCCGSVHGIGPLCVAPEGPVPRGLGLGLRLLEALAVQVGNETVEAGGRAQISQPAPRDFTARRCSRGFSLPVFEFEVKTKRLPR